MADIGDVNRNGQELVLKTKVVGNHASSRMWILRCRGPDCGEIYGANGCDFHIRRCPKHQGGAAGLTIED